MRGSSSSSRDGVRKCCWVCTTELHWADLVRTHSLTKSLDPGSILISPHIIHQPPDPLLPCHVSSLLLTLDSYYSLISVTGGSRMRVCVVAVMMFGVKLGADWTGVDSVLLYSVHWAVLCSTALYTITHRQYSTAWLYKTVHESHYNTTHCCHIRKWGSYKRLKIYWQRLLAWTCQDSGRQLTRTSQCLFYLEFYFHSQHYWQKQFLTRYLNICYGIFWKLNAFLVYYQLLARYLWLSWLHVAWWRHYCQAQT